jgi:kumamolisin
MTHTILTGSARTALPGALAIGKADPAERLEVTVLVRRQAAAELKTRVTQMARAGAGPEHLSREEFAARHGAAQADFAAVRKFAAQHDLTVVQQDAARRTIVLSGTVADFDEAFDIQLQQFEHADGTYRGRTGAIHVPSELAGVIEAVLGLDNRPAARPHLRSLNGSAPAAATTFTPSQIARLYDFPTGTGAGQCIAIIELGGGYRPRDLTTYFTQLGITPPAVTAISVDNAHNRPTGAANGPDGEVMLDIEVAGAIAPGAHLAVYFAPNTDAGFLNAITTAIHDAANKPSVVTISWGGPEDSWTAQALNAFDSAFQAAAVMGVTVLAASGDHGATDGVTDGKLHVDFPASSPHVTACGGTHIQAVGTTVLSETVWNDGPHGGAGGGGVSAFFATPAWQNGLSAKSTAGTIAPLQKRGVPDIAGDADPVSGYRVRVDGQGLVIGGTSAVAPLWAGLVALINQSKGRPCGLINPTLYANQAALTDIVHGNNNGFVAVPGWDPCTGLGSPRGNALAAVL